MATSKDSYLKILIELNNTYIASRAGTVSRCNKFTKLMLTTEDLQLREYLNTYITLLKHHRAWEFNYRHSEDYKITSNNLRVAVKMLDTYLTGCINSQKPEWQILAERNGWKAPNA